MQTHWSQEQEPLSGKQPRSCNSPSWRWVRTRNHSPISLGPCPIVPAREDCTYSLLAACTYQYPLTQSYNTREGQLGKDTGTREVPHPSSNTSAFQPDWASTSYLNSSWVRTVTSVVFQRQWLTLTDMKGLASLLPLCNSARLATICPSVPVSHSTSSGAN